jgi:RNA polymerase sigma-70 factor (ECF subfamily)
VSEEPHDDSGDWPLVVEGDQLAFGKVFDRHADLVYRFVARRTGDRDVAEDVTAQVFLEAWRQRSSIQLFDGSLRSWLLGVAANLVRRHWRSADRASRAIGRLRPPDPVADPSIEATERLDGERELRRLASRINALPAPQAEVLMLWAWEQLTYEEIAAVLGVPVGTVRSRLSRARAHLNGAGGTRFRDRAFPGRKSVAAENDSPDSMEERIER